MVDGVSADGVASLGDVAQDLRVAAGDLPNMVTDTGQGSRVRILIAARSPWEGQPSRVRWS